MDLTDRQADLADAALRLLARTGMAGVTFRSVAAESGWSLGAVQKAFPSREALERAMLARLRAQAGPPPTGEPGRPTLRGWFTDLCCSLLPLDERRRGLVLQGAAFADRAAFDPGIGATIAGSDAELRGLLAALIRRGIAEGEVTALDADAAAWHLLALVQGASAQLLYDAHPEAEMRPLIAEAVARILGPRP